MKWLMMMSPEQLPRTAPAMSGKRREGGGGGVGWAGEGMRGRRQERTREVTA